jgi:hypothetical protein
MFIARDDTRLSLSVTSLTFLVSLSHTQLRAFLTAFSFLSVLGLIPNGELKGIRKEAVLAYHCISVLARVTEEKQANP